MEKPVSTNNRTSNRGKVMPRQDYSSYAKRFHFGSVPSQPSTGNQCRQGERLPRKKADSYQKTAGDKSVSRLKEVRKSVLGCTYSSKFTRLTRPCLNVFIQTRDLIDQDTKLQDRPPRNVPVLLTSLKFNFLVATSPNSRCSTFLMK